MNQADKLKDARRAVEFTCQAIVEIGNLQLADAYARLCYAARLLRELEAREIINHAIGTQAAKTPA